MAEAGLFDEVSVELLDGEIWKMPSQLTPHATAVRKTSLRLRAAFGSSFLVEPQFPITLNDGSEPEPDVVVVPGVPDDYAERHPLPDEIRLLVEVSDTTLRKDRLKKAIDYAKAGIADYWIVNLVNRQLEIYRDPTPDGVYLSVQFLLPPKSISPLHAPTAQILAGDLLPPVPQQP